MPPKDTQSVADKLEERLIEFAVRILRLANRLSTSFAGRHIAGQIVRSGTSPAPNYSEARSAESKADFIHKLRIVVKELNETSVWLRIIARGELVQPALIAGLSEECDELRRIIGASLRTARLRANSQ
jgi:four helix bundle protein